MDKELIGLEVKLREILLKVYDGTLNEETKLEVMVADNRHNLICSLEDYLKSGLINLEGKVEIDIIIRLRYPKRIATIFNASIYSDPQSRNLFRIYEFFIYKDIRNCKLSYILMEYISYIASKLGGKSIMQIFPKGNKHIAFCNKLGFEVIQTTMADIEVLSVKI
jgi:hypothetical protein